MDSTDLKTFTILKDSKGRIHLAQEEFINIDILEESHNRQYFCFDEIVYLSDGTKIYLCHTNYQTCSEYSEQDRDFAIKLATVYGCLHRSIYETETQQNPDELQGITNPVGHLQGDSTEPGIAA